MSELDELLTLFSHHLETGGASRSTLKNYLSDIRHFITWSSASSSSPPAQSQIFSLPNLLSYRDYLSTNSPVATANRHLSSLRKFCSFLVVSAQLSSDPTQNLPNISHVSLPPDPHAPLLSKFRSHLKSSGSTPSTVKNYLSDARNFLNFLSASPPFPNPSSLFESYRHHLTTSTSTSTAHRRLSAVKKFLEFHPPPNENPQPNGQDVSSPLLPPVPPAPFASFGIAHSSSAQEISSPAHPPAPEPLQTPANVSSSSIQLLNLIPEIPPPKSNTRTRLTLSPIMIIIFIALLPLLIILPLLFLTPHSQVLLDPSLNIQ